MTTAISSPASTTGRLRLTTRTTTCSALGPIGTFTIADLSGVTGQRIALDGLSLDVDNACDAALSDIVGTGQCDNVPATPVLDWDPVPDASFYKVYVSQDRNLTNLVYHRPFLRR